VSKKVSVWPPFNISADASAATTTTTSASHPAPRCARRGANNA